MKKSNIIPTNQSLSIDSETRPSECSAFLKSGSLASTPANQRTILLERVKESTPSPTLEPGHGSRTGPLVGTRMKSSRNFLICLNGLRGLQRDLLFREERARNISSRELALTVCEPYSAIRER
jgi:hypothetical protein